MRTLLLLLFIIVGVVSVLAGIVPGGEMYSEANPAGFFWGIWHGWIAPITLITGIFDAQISIYEANNTGWPYDLGFYMAIISGFGGISLSRRK